MIVYYFRVALEGGDVWGWRFQSLNGQVIIRCRSWFRSEKAARNDAWQKASNILEAMGEM